MLSVGLGKIGKILCLVVVICVFSFSAASAASWYTASIYNITPKSDGDGDVFVQFSSTATPPQWDGLARGLIDATEPGANTMIATLLTALSLGYDITIRMENTPSFDTPQVITGLSVQAP